MKKIIKLSICLMLMVGIIISLVFFRKKDSIKETASMATETQTEYSSLDNKKIEWGISRKKDHQQPDVGVKNISLLDKYEGYYMGNKQKPYVYLTFDSGFEAGYTSKILDALKENDVKATFFLTQHYINTAPDLVKRMIEEGHTVGNHTCKHKSLPTISESELKKEVMDLHSLVYEKFGYEMKYIRPPKGEYSEKVLAITNSLGYKTVMWSMAYDDWDEEKQGREEYGKQKVIENVHNGAIILLHATSKDNSNILGDCIKEIKSMGYEFRGLDEFER